MAILYTFNDSWEYPSIPRNNFYRATWKIPQVSEAMIHNDVEPRLPQAVTQGHFLMVQERDTSSQERDTLLVNPGTLLLNQEQQYLFPHDT